MCHIISIFNGIRKKLLLELKCICNMNKRDYRLLLSMIIFENVIVNLCKRDCTLLEPHDMIGIVNNSDIFTKIFHLSRGE